MSRVGLALIGAGLAFACAKAEPIRDGEQDASDAAATDAPEDAPPDVVVDVAQDSVADVVTDAAAGCQCGEPFCGNCPGVAQVAAGGYSIDATEVTNAAYGDFLATNPKTSLQPAECAGNTSYLPNSGWPAALDRQLHPVVDVDWCDARAYCGWAKKRLCGRVGGGANPYGDFTDSTKSQWHNACSGGGSRTFPYGVGYVAATCNGADYGAGATTAAGSVKTCEGGYPGLFDMSGNVWEWEDSCNATSGADDLCRIRGGSYAQNQSNLHCAADSALPRGSAGKAVGFRCCS
ncbi:MAG: formylglycine-generating enzyme family protein [Polyangiaceae bacterium]